MHIGKRLLVKHNNIVQEGKVENIYQEELEIRLDNNEVITRKFWETRSIKKEVENEKTE
jgi:hypothetical protein